MNKKILSVLSAGAGALIGSVVSAKRVNKKAEAQKNKIKGMSDKHLDLFLMMNQWVRVKQKGKNLSEFFERNGYKKIAVYGMSYAGQTLIEELQDSNIEIAYGIDKKADKLDADFRIVSVDGGELEMVDAVVVTAITFFDEIEEILIDKMDCPIISLEDVLNQI